MDILIKMLEDYCKKHEDRFMEFTWLSPMTRGSKQRWEITIFLEPQHPLIRRSKVTWYKLERVDLFPALVAMIKRLEI